MPITLSWFDDKHSIILCTFEGQWTWQEYTYLEKNIWDFIENADYRIDILADWSLSAGFPLGLMDIIHRIGENRVPEQTKSMVVNISQSPMLKILIGAFRRLYSKEAKFYQLAGTLDDAIKLLEQDRGEAITQSISAFK